MKTLVKDNFSLYVFQDVEVVNIAADKTTIGNPEQLIISDCNSTNSVMYENVSPPEDWSGCKYFYINNTWTLNPNWVANPIVITSEPESP